MNEDCECRTTLTDVQQQKLDSGVARLCYTVKTRADGTKCKYAWLASRKGRSRLHVSRHQLLRIAHMVAGGGDAKDAAKKVGVCKSVLLDCVLKLLAKEVPLSCKTIHDENQQAERLC